MKRIGAFLLLLTLAVAISSPLQAQRMTPEENARQSRKATKDHQKMLKHANKKQSKAQKKFEKTQRKQTKKANRDLAHRRTSVVN
jgi:hypothetical protein